MVGLHHPSPTKHTHALTELNMDNKDGRKESLFCNACTELSCSALFFVLAGCILSHVHRSHEVNGPFKCHECSATFLQRIYLHQHASSTHRPRSFLCPFCDSRSRSPLILRLHCARCKGSRGQDEREEDDQLEQMDIRSDCPLGEGEKQEEVEQQETNEQEKEQEED